MSTARTAEQSARKRIRDARYRQNNCGRIQARIREWLRANKPQRVLKELRGVS